MIARVCVRTSSLYAHTSSGRKSRRVLLDRFVAMTTRNRWSRGQPSRKTTPFRSPLYFWQTPELCAQSLWRLLRWPFRRASHSNPSIAITSLVAASKSNPTFRRGTSDDMRALLSRNRGRVQQKFAFAIYTLTRRTVPLVASSWKWLAFRRTATGSSRFLPLCTRM